jgi:hypothetical protein
VAFFASVSNIAKIGRSILNSTLLNANTTRAWLKPTSFIPDLRSAVGRLWEIYRFDASASEHRGIDMYGKGGDAKPSHSWIGSLPDYNIGVALVIGNPDNKDWINDQIFEIVYPTLKSVARRQAEVTYAGTYKVSHGLSSTITLTTEAGKPGLDITQWFSNSIDVYKAFTQLSDELLTSDNFRLLPKNLERSLDDGGEEVLWRMLRSTSYPRRNQSPLAACPTWLTIDGVTYGHFSIDEFLFTLDGKGKALKVIPRAWKMERGRLS